MSDVFDIMEATVAGIHGAMRRCELTCAELVEEYTERFTNPYIAAERGMVDDVIDPADTRRKVIAGFEMLRSKREELPKRKHGNVPL